MSYILKVVFVGSTGTGKSSIICRAVDGEFSESTLRTIGVDFRIINTKVNDVDVRLQIWDTAGQDRFRTIVSSYYRGAKCVVFVYDVSSKDTLKDIPMWYEEVNKYGRKNPIVILVGNKDDIVQREVSYAEGAMCAKKYNMHYIETSAKTNHNIVNLMNFMVNELYKKETNDVSMVNTKPIEKLNITKSQKINKRCWKD